MKTILFTIYSFLAIATTALNAQQLEMVWKSPAGDNVVMSGGSTMLLDSLDANFDGVKDLVLVKEGQANLEVVNGTNQNELWGYPLPLEGVWNDTMLVVGFFKFFNQSSESGDLKTMVVGRKIGNRVHGLPNVNAVVYNEGVAAFNSKYRMVNIRDYDNDGLSEMLLYNRSTKQLELWGKSD